MHYIFILLFALVAGCTNTNNEIEPMINNDNNPRIIYRDLTKLSNNNVDLISDIKKKPIPLYIPNEKNKEIFIEKCDIKIEKVTDSKTTYQLLNNNILLVGFYNEQIRPHDQNQLLDNFLRSVNVNNKYIIMGHSHGLSSLGVEKLAYMRANYVKNLLVKQGVLSENIITLANWSKKKVIGTPSLGVEIYY